MFPIIGHKLMVFMRKINVKCCKMFVSLSDCKKDPDLCIRVPLHRLLDQFEHGLQGLLLPAGRIYLQVKILRDNEKVRHLVGVYQVLVEEAG